MQHEDEIALLLCRYHVWSLPSSLPLLNHHLADAPAGERGEKEVKLQARTALELGEENNFFKKLAIFKAFLVVVSLGWEK